MDLIKVLDQQNVKAELPVIEVGSTVRTPYLCDEGLAETKRFTGALLGLGAVGAGKAAFRGHALEQKPVL